MKARSVFTVRCWLPVLALACASAAGSAHAAVYTGVWDPLYGAPFTHLGWRGVATYAVPDNCELSGSGDISNVANCGGAAAVSSAVVEFYDDTSAGHGTLATLTFDPQSLVIGTLRYLNGNLDELTTTASNLVTAGSGLGAFGVSSSVGFTLQFDLTGPHLAWQLCGDDTRACERGTNSFAPQFSITRVPEPGSLFLSGLALTALLATARRRALNA